MLWIALYPALAFLNVWWNDILKDKMSSQPTIGWRVNGPTLLLFSIRNGSMAKRNQNSQIGIVKGNPRNSVNSRVFIDGSTRSYAILRTAAIGFGTYQPGWRWSLHAGPQTGKNSENHIGYVISGRMMVKDISGNDRPGGPS